MGFPRTNDVFLENHTLGLLPIQTVILHQADPYDRANQRHRRGDEHDFLRVSIGLDDGVARGAPPLIA